MPTGLLHFKHKVMIDGGDLAGITLAGATINYGIRNPDESPTPANAYLTLISADAVPNIGPQYPGFSWGAGIPSGFVDVYTDLYEGSLPRINVGGTVEIDATTPTGFVDTYTDTYDGGFETTRFVGIITALDVNAGAISITAVTASEHLTRITVDPSGWPAESDVARVQRVATATGVPITVEGTLTVGMTPKGVAESPVAAWDLLTEVVAASSGVLYTNRLGSVRYRTRTATPGDTVTLGDAATMMDDLTMSMELGAVQNHIAVTYGPSDTPGTVTVIDAESVALYGRRDGRYSVAIETQVGAEDFADRMLTHYGHPYWRMPVATVNLRLAESLGAFPGYLQEILTIDLDDSVYLPHLLPASPLPDYLSRVLGYQEILDPVDWSISFSLNPAGWTKP
jgi:hypothetical protein